MRRYTLDASGLLRYFIDRLPPRADEVFENALAGEAILELPAVAAAEVAYIAYTRDDIAGRPFRGAPEDVVDVLEADGPFVLDPIDLDVVAEMLSWQEAFPRQLHDAMIVASHVVNETEAVITSDSRIGAHVRTIWS